LISPITSAASLLVAYRNTCFAEPPPQYTDRVQRPWDPFPLTSLPSDFITFSKRVACPRWGPDLISKNSSSLSSFRTKVRELLALFQLLISPSLLKEATSITRLFSEAFSIPSSSDEDFWRDWHSNDDRSFTSTLITSSQSTDRRFQMRRGYMTYPDAFFPV
jgi:hypothetical protein